MALDATFAHAFIDGGVTPRLLGLRVRPFCIWHLFLLHALDSPFIRKGEVGSFELRTAIGVCRLRGGDSRIRRPAPWRLSLRSGNLRFHVTQFLHYTRDYVVKPDYAVVAPPAPRGSTPAPKIVPAPELLRVVADIVGWSGCSFRDAWELPVGQAYWWQSMALRARGERLDFMDDRHREIQRQMKEAKAQKLEASLRDGQKK